MTPVGSAAARAGSIPRPLRTRRYLGHISIVIILAFLFSQLWFEVGGATVRSEDLAITLIILGAFAASALTLKLRPRRSPLDRPLAFGAALLCVSVAHAVFSPLDPVANIDAVVNGSRSLLVIILYWLVLNHPSYLREKARARSTQ